MTMICPAKNKAELKAKLDAGCTVTKPDPWGSVTYHSSELAVGFREPVVLDPDTRRRFATIKKRTDGWKVT